MAEGGVRRKVTPIDDSDVKLDGDARVTVQLLNQVAKNVYPEKLGTFARDLGVRQTTLGRITAVNTLTVDEQIYQVKPWIVDKKTLSIFKR